MHHRATIARLAPCSSWPAPSLPPLPAAPAVSASGTAGPCSPPHRPNAYLNPLHHPPLAPPATAPRYRILLDGSPQPAPVSAASLGSLLSGALTALQAHADAWPFHRPVDVAEAFDYYDIIKDPVDLSLVATRLGCGTYYRTLDMFMADLRRMFANCRRAGRGAGEEGTRGLRARGMGGGGVIVAWRHSMCGRCKGCAGRRECGSTATPRHPAPPRCLRRRGPVHPHADTATRKATPRCAARDYATPSPSQVLQQPRDAVLPGRQPPRGGAGRLHGGAPGV